MFRLSKAAEYAVRGVLHLACESNSESAGVEEIAKAQDVSAAYLAKLFQALARKGFVKSSRGRRGGFKLAREAKNITLLEVIEAMEGPIYLNDCLIHTGFCPRDAVCPVHDVWREAQKRFLDFLKSCTFEKLAESARLKSQNVAAGQLVAAKR